MAGALPAEAVTQMGRVCETGDRKRWRETQTEGQEVLHVFLDKQGSAFIHKTEAEKCLGLT